MSGGETTRTCRTAPAPHPLTPPQAGAFLFGALPFAFGPCLLAAFALQHAEGSATEGIQHRPNKGGLPPASIAGRCWIWLVAGKDFVLELVTHLNTCLGHVR